MAVNGKGGRKAYVALSHAGHSKVRPTGTPWEASGKTQNRAGVGKLSSKQPSTHSEQQAYPCASPKANWAHTKRTPRYGTTSIGMDRSQDVGSSTQLLRRWSRDDEKLGYTPWWAAPTQSCGETAPPRPSPPVGAKTTKTQKYHRSTRHEKCRPWQTKTARSKNPAITWNTIPTAFCVPANGTRAFPDLKNEKSTDHSSTYVWW